MGRSQRHMIFEQGAPANGEPVAQGQPAPTYIDQYITEDMPPEQRKVPDLRAEGGDLIVPVGPPGGPLQGSTMAGALPADIPEPPEPGPEPGVIVITSPTEGATVPPVHDIIGTGALPNAEVQLWYGGQNPAEDEPASTTTADAAGNWGFTGDTPAALGPVTWGVASGGYMATVNITVEAEGGTRRGKAAERGAPTGPLTILRIEDHDDGIQLELSDASGIPLDATVLIEATGNTNINGSYEVWSVDGNAVIVNNDYTLDTPIEGKGRLTVT